MLGFAPLQLFTAPSTFTRERPNPPKSLPSRPWPASPSPGRLRPPGFPSTATAPSPSAPAATSRRRSVSEGKKYKREGDRVRVPPQPRVRPQLEPDGGALPARLQPVPAPLLRPAAVPPGPAEEAAGPGLRGGALLPAALLPQGNQHPRRDARGRHQEPLLPLRQGGRRPVLQGRPLHRPRLGQSRI